eukprot:1142571-Pelagomonas_calceolata.AAC.1
MKRVQQKFFYPHAAELRLLLGYHLMKNKTCAQKPAHSSLAFQRKLPSSPIAINTIASCLSMSKNTGNYCSSTSASTALGIPFLQAHQ